MLFAPHCRYWRSPWTVGARATICLLMGPTDSASFGARYPETIHDAQRRVIPMLQRRLSRVVSRASFFEQTQFWICSWTTLVRRHMWTAIVPTFVSTIGALIISTTATAQNPAEPLVKEPGLATDPAISADGRWLVYASDRGGSRSLNLWLRPLAGGDARKLTEEASDQHEPAFSPDGTTLAYRSEAGEGGIYLISVKGGRPRLLIRGGRRPRFSSDGKRIVYWAANGLFVIDTSGGQPRAIHPDFRSARDGVWSPDGKYLIFAGCRDDSAKSCDCWVTRWKAASQSQRARRIAWAGSRHLICGWPDNEIVFTVKNGDKGGLWILNLAANSWRAIGTPQRLTSAGYDARSPAAGPGGNDSVCQQDDEHRSLEPASGCRSRAGDRYFDPFDR